MTIKIEQDFSKIDCFERCKRLYFILHVLGLTTKAEAAAPEFGKKIHSFLSKWYATGNQKEAMSVFANWEDREGDDVHTLARAIDIMINYMTVYSTEPWQIIANELAIEQKLEIPEEYKDFMLQWGFSPSNNLEEEIPYWYDPALEFYLIGKVDLVIQWNDLIYGADWKTARSIGDSFFNRFRPDMQMYGYNYALHKIYGDNVQGMLVRAISKAKTASITDPKKPQMFKQQLITRTRSELAEYPYVMIPLMYDCWRRENEVKDAFASLDGEYPVWQEGSWKPSSACLSDANFRRSVDFFFPPSYRACNDYGSCKFRSLCLSNLHQEELARLVPNEWDPRTVTEE
jgi:hypothetical protein